MRQVEILVEGAPPAKNEPKSMLAAGHSQSNRVLALLDAARTSTLGLELPVFAEGQLVMDVVGRPRARTGRRLVSAMSGA